MGDVSVDRRGVMVLAARRASIAPALALGLSWMLTIGAPLANATGFGAPAQLGSGGFFAPEVAPKVVVDPQGNVMAAWRGERAEASQCTRSAVVGTSRPANSLVWPAGDAISPWPEESDSCLGSFDVDVDDAGNVTAVWSLRDAPPVAPVHRIRSRRWIAVTGTWGTSEDLAVIGQAGPVAVDVNGAGAVGVAWIDGADDTVRARLRTAAGSWGATQVLSAAPASDLDVAVDSSGAMHVVWQATVAVNEVIHAREVPAGGDATSTVTETLSGVGGTAPLVIADGADAITAVWTLTGAAPPAIQQVTRPAGSPWTGVAQTVSPPDGARHSSPDIAAASSAAGGAAIVWRRGPLQSDGSSIAAVQASVRPAGATSFDAAQVVVSSPSPSYGFASPRIAYDEARSTHVAVWEYEDITYAVGERRPRKRQNAERIGGTWSAAHDLTAMSTVAASNWGTDLQVNSRGVGSAIWAEGNRIFAAPYPAPAGSPDPGTDPPAPPVAVAPEPPMTAPNLDRDGDHLPDGQDCAPEDGTRPAKVLPDVDCNGVTDAGPVTRTGSGTRDTLTGGAFADLLRGLGGADKLFGGGGDDRGFGGGGNDLLHGGPGRDRLDGGPGKDRIYGGTGADLLQGGGGVDAIFGGAASDIVFARDGRPDVVSCGPGIDTATVDRHDRTISCERIRRP